MSPLSADDLARLRELDQYDRTAPLLAETARHLVDTVDELRSLLAEARPYLMAPVYADGTRVLRGRAQIDLAARIDAALSAEPASTD